MIRHVPIAPGAGRLDLRGGWRLRSDFDDILVLSLKPGLFGAVRSPRFQIQNNPEHIQRMVMFRPPDLDHAAAANIHLQRPAPLETACGEIEDDSRRRSFQSAYLGGRTSRHVDDDGIGVVFLFLQFYFLDETTFRTHGPDRSRCRHRQGGIKQDDFPEAPPGCSIGIFFDQWISFPTIFIFFRPIKKRRGGVNMNVCILLKIRQVRMRRG